MPGNPLSRERAARYWRGSAAHKARYPPQQVILKAWFLYVLRITLTWDLCSAWKEFGGPSDQLSFLSAALQLDAAENVALAISQRILD